MNTKPLLIVSLIGNLALAAALAWLAKARCCAPGAAPAPAAVQADAKSANASSKKKSDKAASAAASSKADQKFDWRMVESEDYKKYIANLRYIGCPEETIRDIII